MNTINAMKVNNNNTYTEFESEYKRIRDNLGDMACASEGDTYVMLDNVIDMFAAMDRQIYGQKLIIDKLIATVSKLENEVNELKKKDRA